MKPAPIPSDDLQRLQALRELLILDTPSEERFDRLAAFAVSEFDVPICVISLVDQNRQWFKARVGLDVCETARDVSFCAHALQQSDVLLIEDAWLDERFHDNPMVVGDIHAAPSHEAAAQMLLAHRFNAFVISVGADGEGLKLINAIRAGAGRTARDAAVVVMADFCDERAIVAFKQLQIRRVLLKPFKVKDVLETIQALAQREMMSA